MLVTVSFTSICRISESLTGWGETWRSRTRPRNLRSLYLGRTSDEENGWNTRPIKPRFCRVVVVIGVAVGAAEARTDAVVSGVAKGFVSCARRSAAVARTAEKMMA